MFHDTVEIHSSNDHGVIVARMPAWGLAAEMPDQRAANAAFIITACNEYDALKAQNAELVAALQDARDALADLNQREEDDGELLDKIDAALAKASACEPARSEVAP